METIIITLDNNKKKEYVKGIKLKEIIEQEKDKLTNTVVGALYNNNMIDYEETLTKNGKIYIYDLNTKEGNKIYEKGLLYLFEVSAVEALGKDTQIIVKHSIDKGIYCKVNKPLTTDKNSIFIPKWSYPSLMMSLSLSSTYSQNSLHRNSFLNSNKFSLSSICSYIFS